MRMRRLGDANFALAVVILAVVLVAWAILVLVC